MAHIDRDGVRIFYEVHGREPAGETEPDPVLLTHGYSASSAMWAENLGVLSAGRRVITWDIRGHGLSDSPAEPDRYSQELSIADMVAVLAECGVQRAVIGGMSLGRYLSLAFNIAHPEMVAGLLLVDTGPGYRRDEPRQAWNAVANRWADQFERHGLEALGPGLEVRATTHRNPAGLALAARRILTQNDSSVIDSLPGITVPTLVVVGADDALYLDAADVMAAKIPGASKVVIAAAGHAANMDQPEVFNRAVVEFLATV